MKCYYCGEEAVSQEFDRMICDNNSCYHKLYKDILIELAKEINQLEGMLNELKQTMMTPKYYSVTEAAKIIGVKRQAVVRYIEKGELPASKVGRFWRICQTDLDYFLSSKKTSTTGKNG